MNREQEEAAPGAPRGTDERRAAPLVIDRALVRVLVQAQREVQFELELERRALDRDDLT